jgi:hypothetical protein
MDANSSSGLSSIGRAWVAQWLTEPGMLDDLLGGVFGSIPQGYPTFEGTEGTATSKLGTADTTAQHPGLTNAPPVWRHPNMTA